MQVNLNQKDNQTNFKVLKPSSLGKKTIYIVDAMPGMGKTESAINYINSCNNKTKFIYVTPYLNEINRIIKSCPNKKFKQPKNNTSNKKKDFFKLLKTEQNIVCTHSLFDNFDSDCYDLLSLAKNKKYILIMDEVADVVKQVNLSSEDLNILLNTKTLCHIDKETCQLVWDDDTYKEGRFADIKNKAELGSIYVYGNVAFFWTFPIKIFKAFQKVFILTYKYTGQIQSAYYNFFNVETKYIHIENHINSNGEIDKFYFIDKVFNEPQKCNVDEYKKLINICQDEELNKIGESNGTIGRGRLSKSWYVSNKENDTGLINLVKENTIAYFSKFKNSKVEYNMWTCFKDFQNDLKGPRYAKNFISCNMRATNEYIDKYNLAYLINCYLNPLVKNFFLQKNIKIDENEYALSEMLQWIFRSRIRKHEPINIYVPSQRMRELLENWE